MGVKNTKILTLALLNVWLIFLTSNALNAHTLNNQLVIKIFLTKVKNDNFSRSTNTATFCVPIMTSKDKQRKFAKQKNF